MRVRLDIGLDLDGIHTFRWEPSDAPGAIEVPKTTLDRWTAEREAFHLAHLRWRRVSEEIEEALYRAESARSRGEPLAAAVSEPEPALSYATAGRPVVRSTRRR